MKNLDIDSYRPLSKISKAMVAKYYEILVKLFLSPWDMFATPETWNFSFWCILINSDKFKTTSFGYCYYG